jgi:hypothetical protein
VKRVSPSAPLTLGHNGGPVLDDPPEHVPPWGAGGFLTYFGWKRARKAARNHAPVEVRIRRDDRAEALGLTYDEYTLEVLERGRLLQVSDTARITAIKAARRPVRGE